MSLVVSQDQFSDTLCTICYSDIEYRHIVGNNIVAPYTNPDQNPDQDDTCGHLFHRNCLKRWIGILPWFFPGTCPNCRENTYSLITVRRSELVNPLLQQEGWYEYFCSFLPDLSSIFGSDDIETEDVFLEDISFCTDLSSVAAIIFLIYVFELIFDFLFNLEPGIRFD